MKVDYDLNGEPNVDRVHSVEVLCTECRIPEYVPLDEDKLYRIIVPSFIGGGGDGYSVLKENAQKYAKGDTNKFLYICKSPPFTCNISCNTCKVFSLYV